MLKVTPKPLFWVGSSLDDLRDLPEPVQNEFGFALYQAQIGAKPLHAKPLKGFRGAGVLEIVENNDTDTYRAVYTVRFSEVVYVLHVFQKKSKQGLETPQRELSLIRSRLKRAEEDYQIWMKERDNKE